MTNTQQQPIEVITYLIAMKRGTDRYFYTQAGEWDKNRELAAKFATMREAFDFEGTIYPRTREDELMLIKLREFIK